MTPDELDRLVVRFQRGDRQAFTAIVLDVEKEVRIFLSTRATSIDMVDEVFQQALVTCYENIAKYEPRGTFLSWLKGIARNRLLKELDERKRFAAAGGDQLEQVVNTRAHETVDTDDHDASIARLRDCIGRLPPHSRQLIEDRYTAGRAVKKLAASMQRSESWVAVTLFRIRQLLKTCLERAPAPGSRTGAAT